MSFVSVKTTAKDYTIFSDASLKGWGRIDDIGW